MTANLPKLVVSNRLPVLASSINDHLAAAEAATRRGLEHAIAAGLLLIEAKELVDHGQWLPWLRANCRVSERPAQGYMHLARNRHKLDALKNESIADLTLSAAMKLVGRPRPERPHGLPGQLDLLGGPEALPPAMPAAIAEREKNRHLQYDNLVLRREVKELRAQLPAGPTSAREVRALIGPVVAWLWKWSDADERQRHKIIQILEHAGRLIEQLEYRTNRESAR